MRADEKLLSGKGVESYTVRGAAKVGQDKPRTALTIRSFTLPIPPTTNTLFANVKGVGRVKTKKYRLWSKSAEADLFAQKVSGTAPVPCAVSIVIYGGNGFNENRDLDNCAKAVMDLLVSQGILEGDSIRFVPRLTLAYVSQNTSPSHCLVTITDYYSGRALS